MKHFIEALSFCTAVVLLAVISAVTAFAAPGKSKTISVKSPDGQNEVVVTVAGDIRYDVISKGGFADRIDE